MKTTKKIIAILAIIATVISCFAISANAASNISVVNGRKDGSWLFPLESKYYSSISDWAGCNANGSTIGSCPFHGSSCKSNATCGADHFGGNSSFGHNGIDIAAPKGTKVFAAASGTLYYVNYSLGARGLTAVIEHKLNANDSYYSYYQHLNGFNSNYKSGTKVNAGDTIGYVGNTGGNYGDHLHFGIVFGQAGKGNDTATGNYLNTLENLGWITNKEHKYGRIVVNPDTENAATGLDTVNSHRGSIHYVFNKSEVKIPTIEDEGIFCETKPTSIKRGCSFGLKGIITYKKKITNVTAGIYTDANGKNAKQKVSINPNSTTYDLSGKVNDSLVFNNLSKGTFYYRVTAKVDGKTNILINRKFTIVSSLTLSGITKPTSINQGKCFGLKGTITNLRNITNVTAGIYTDASGKNAKQKVSVNPNAKSYNLNGKVNNSLIFNDLPKGTYYYRVTVKDAYGTEVPINQKFTVK